MFLFLETDLREKNYEKRIQTSVDNTVKCSTLWNQVWKLCERQQ